jgi:hypothetical protein
MPTMVVIVPPSCIAGISDRVKMYIGPIPMARKPSPKAMNGLFESQKFMKNMGYV